MRHKHYLQLLLVACLALLLSHCAAKTTQSQLQFGIQSAKKELWDEAIFRWKKVLTERPDSAAAHNNLAVAYELKALWDEAKKEYELALKYAPGDEYIQANYEKFKTRYESKAENKDEYKDETKKK